MLFISENVIRQINKNYFSVLKEDGSEYCKLSWKNKNKEPKVSQRSSEKFSNGDLDLRTIMALTVASYMFESLEGIAENIVFDSGVLYVYCSEDRVLGFDVNGELLTSVEDVEDEAWVEIIGKISNRMKNSGGKSLASLIVNMEYEGTVY